MPRNDVHNKVANLYRSAAVVRVWYDVATACLEVQTCTVYGQQAVLTPSSPSARP